MVHQRGFQSSLILDFETAFGVDPGSPDAKKVPIESSDLNRKTELISPPTITGNRGSSKPYPGNDDISGGVEVPLTISSIGWWLRAMFGLPVTTGAGPFVHTFKESVSQESMVLERDYPQATQFQKFNGCKVSSLSMDIEAGSPGIVAQMNLLGAKETFGGSAYDATPTVYVEDRFLFRQLSIEEGGSTLANGHTVNFEVDFGLDAEIYLLGGAGQRGALTEGRLAISGSLTALFENLTLLNKAINSTESSLKLTFTSGTNIFEILFPEIQYSVQSPELSKGNEGVMVTLPWTAYRDNDAENSSIKATLTNGITDYT